MISKKEIIQDAEEVAEKFVKKYNANKQVDTTINVVKKYMSYIKNFDVDSFLSINEDLMSKSFIGDKEAFKMLKNTVKERKNKYSKDELLNFLGYLARALTFYK
jgi:hypothetical protein